MNSIDSALDRFTTASKSWLTDTLALPLSETDTRCKAIDFVLIDVLGWEESHIRREPKLEESTHYIDYLLSTTRAIFIVEAKRSKEHFHLPSVRAGRHFKIGGVISNDKARAGPGNFDSAIGGISAR